MPAPTVNNSTNKTIGVQYTVYPFIPCCQTYIFTVLCPNASILLDRHSHWKPGVHAIPPAPNLVHSPSSPISRAQFFFSVLSGRPRSDHETVLLLVVVGSLPGSDTKFHHHHHRVYDNLD